MFSEMHAMFQSKNKKYIFINGNQWNVTMNVLLKAESQFFYNSLNSYHVYSSALTELTLFTLAKEAVKDVLLAA